MLNTDKNNYSIAMTTVTIGHQLDGFRLLAAYQLIFCYLLMLFVNK